MVKIIFRLLSIFLFFFFTVSLGISAQDLKIVTTTSLIECIVKEIGRERIEVVNIVPGGFCPGHFDLRPKDVLVAAQAKILLCHGWEGWLNKLLSFPDKRALKIKKIGIEGNCMVPDIHIRAVDKIEELLCNLDNRQCSYFQKNAQEYKKRIMNFVEGIKKFNNLKTIASELQRPFLEWLGIKVVVTYRRSEELSPSQIIDLMKIGKEEKINLVVDNLQSGYHIGKQMAKELGAKHIVLTNFPLDGSYIDSLKENIKIISDALK